MKKLTIGLLVILLASCTKSTVTPVIPAQVQSAGIVTPGVPVAQQSKDTVAATTPPPTTFEVYSASYSDTIYISNIVFKANGQVTCTATASKSGSVFMNFVFSPGGVQVNLVMDYGCILNFSPSGSDDTITMAGAGYNEVVNITSL